MMLNLTLVVQAGNFLIAYVMIRKFLLHPAVSSIYEDDAAYIKALTKIETRKKRVATQERRIKGRWRAFQQTFLEHEPLVARAEEVAVTIVPGMPELPAIDERQINQLVQEVADKMIEKVAHVLH